MELLEFAIEMELEGEKYYLEQAAINRENGLNIIFISLANDEAHHAKILQNKAKGAPDKLDGSIKSSAQNVFDGMGDFNLDIKSNPEQLDVYRMALEKEKQSIDLYQKLLSESQEDKEFYQFLISQEEEHYRIVDEIIKALNRPNEWVESAEFGVREEY